MDLQAEEAARDGHPTGSAGLRARTSGTAGTEARATGPVGRQSSGILVAAIAAAFVVVELTFDGRYGYHRDEL